MQQACQNQRMPLSRLAPLAGKVAGTPEKTRSLPFFGGLNAVYPHTAQPNWRESPQSR
jgi:hypothetical protein